MDALTVGDHFICAGERQRDLWIGAMLGGGLITPAVYGADPTLRSVIDVVPSERLFDEALRILKWAKDTGAWQEARRKKRQPVGLSEEQLDFASAVARGMVMAKTKGQLPAPLAAVEAVMRGCNRPLDEGIEIEILDLRTLAPYDWAAIRASVEKTSRVIVAHEDCLSWGYGAELAARIGDELFTSLDAPVRRVGALDTWVGYHPQLETAILPQTETLAAEMARILEY